MGTASSSGSGSTITASGNQTTAGTITFSASCRGESASATVDVIEVKSIIPKNGNTGSSNFLLGSLSKQHENSCKTYKSIQGENPEHETALSKPTFSSKKA